MPEQPRASVRALADLCAPWCLRVVATLGIAEMLENGVTEVAQLAAAAECDREMLHTVLSELVVRGVFEETAPGRFALNEAARELLEPRTRGFLDLHGFGGRMAYAWGTLPTFVRSGRSGYHEVFGRPFWEDLDANPKIAADFDAAMGPAGHGLPDPNFEIDRGWDSIRTVVDVGGGTGAMLAEILKARPHVRGTLVDLPGTIERAVGTFEAAGLTGRVRLAPQSFFDALPAGADLYLLKSVLNDWPDRETVAILQRCAEAARPDGRIVVMGGVRPDDAPRRLGIDMVLTGSRTNTVEEFRDLAGEAGLEIVAARARQTGGLVVELRPIPR
jgi:SAM-dependent methyltransferase